MSVPGPPVQPHKRRCRLEVSSKPQQIVKAGTSAARPHLRVGSLLAAVLSASLHSLLAAGCCAVCSPLAARRGRLRAGLV